MMMSIVSTAAYTERRLTRSLPGMGMFIVVAILSHFLLVQFLGDLTALIRNSVYNLTKYDFEVKEFLVKSLSCNGWYCIYKVGFVLDAFIE